MSDLIKRRAYHRRAGEATGGEATGGEAEAVVLCGRLGHRLAEIARLTGACVAAAQSRLIRGRRKALRLLKVAERPAREQ